ncbi:MAG: DUF455 family protein [Cryobacterium sp.]|nr:DUF455 family protein [Oligoflexia bacterium]
MTSTENLVLDPIPSAPGYLEAHPEWTPSWGPFLVLPRTDRGKSPRAITSREGLSDRLRAAAFAEIQAYYAFLWAADRFEDAPAALKKNWRELAAAEERHLNWLLRRMTELGLEVRERGVSDWLWLSLIQCKTAREFSHFIASSEERGRIAGERFHTALIEIDPMSAEIFRKIAEEEVEHIRLASKFFPDGSETGPLAEKLLTHS